MGFYVAYKRGVDFYCIYCTSITALYTSLQYRFYAELIKIGPVDSALALDTRNIIIQLGSRDLKDLK